MKRVPMKKSALKISLTALCASLICLCSWISVPLGGVPMTLQVFGVAFCGFLLGVRGGICATAVYLALGAVGLPVFAGFGGSLAFLSGPTGGFLIGFLFLSIFCGLASRTKKRVLSFSFSIIGLMLCHLLGTGYFSHVTEISFLQAFFIASLPYLLKDLLSLLFASFLIGKLRKRLPHAYFFKNET